MFRGFGNLGWINGFICFMRSKSKQHFHSFTAGFGIDLTTGSNKDGNTPNSLTMYVLKQFIKNTSTTMDTVLSSLMFFVQPNQTVSRSKGLVNLHSLVISS
jgi:hypothetical protein